MTSIALVHPTTLLGQELRQALQEARELWTDARLLSADEDEVGTLVDLDGANFVKSLNAEELDGADWVFLCGTAEASQSVIPLLPSGATVISMDPSSGDEGGPALIEGVNTDPTLPAGLYRSAHPGAVLLGQIALALAPLRPASLAATVLQPVSIFGAAGIDELADGTRRLLTMQGAPEESLFQRQIAFNLFPASGANRLAQEIESGLGVEAPPVSVQLIQAGIFHAFATSLHVRFADEVSADAAMDALSESPFLRHFSSEEFEADSLGPIDAASEATALLAPPRSDGRGGLWIWAAIDNLTRGGALNAVGILRAVR